MLDNILFFLVDTVAKCFLILRGRLAIRMFNKDREKEREQIIKEAGLT